MNIIQAFRRIGQQMNGWSTLLNVQYYQMVLVKKLYSKNGFEIKGGGACPEQYDVFKNGKQVGYYRLRHGEFTVDYPDVNGEEILREYPNGDGIFNNDERLIYLSKAMRKIISRIEE